MHRENNPAMKAINAKEAAQLFMAVDNAGLIKDGKAVMSGEQVMALIGDLWQVKLNYVKGAATIVANGTKFEVTLDIEKLEEIATSPAGANEVSRFMSRRLGGAGKALEFLFDRMERPARDRAVFFSEQFLSGFLGPLWEDRLKAVGIEATRGSYRGEPQIYLPVEPILTYAQAAMENAARSEHRR